MKNTLFLFLFVLLLVACGDNSSSTSAINLNDDGKNGFMTDSRDGQTYRIVIIGEQIWMAHNLNYATSNSYCYNDDASYCSKYGPFYTWAAAVGKSEDVCGYDHTCSLPSGNIQGVCPSGWHLPSKVEWKKLITTVGGAWVAALKLKSTYGWSDKSDSVSGNGTDAFLFSALSSGVRRYGGDYGDEGDCTFFWSSTENSSNYAYYMGLFNYSNDSDLSYYYSKNYGFSVRCIKD